MYRKKEGYTLIELTVVIILVGLLMTFTIPRFRASVLNDTRKTSVRRMISLIYSVRNNAVRDNRGYILRFDQASVRYWIESLDMPDLDKSLAKENAKILPNDVAIKDITIVGEDKDIPGESRIRFHRKGYTEPALIQKEILIRSKRNYLHDF